MFVSYLILKKTPIKENTKNKGLKSSQYKPLHKKSDHITN